MVNVFVLFPLGFILGILTDFFGEGGGFLLTPALNILGFQMVYAIGTGFSVIAGNALIGAITHHKLGNVDFILGIIPGLFSSGGVELGKRLVSGEDEPCRKVCKDGLYCSSGFDLTLNAERILSLPENEAK